MVTVTDGRLTITNADGAMNNKLDFIEINQIGGGNAPATLSSGGGAGPFLPFTRSGMDDAGSASALSGNSSLVDITFRTLPQVVSDRAGYTAREPSRPREESPTFIAWGPRSEPPMPMPEAVVDDSRPVLDDKTRFWLECWG